MATCMCWASTLFPRGGLQPDDGQDSRGWGGVPFEASESERKEAAVLVLELSEPEDYPRGRGLDLMTLGAPAFYPVMLLWKERRASQAVADN